MDCAVIGSMCESIVSALCWVQGWCRRPRVACVKIEKTPCYVSGTTCIGSGRKCAKLHDKDFTFYT